MLGSARTDALWWAYAAATGARGPRSTIAFADEPGLATAIGRLVLTGRKRANAAIDGIGATGPTPGHHRVVVDGAGMPLCIVRTTKVERRTFADVDEAFAEADGHENLNAWRGAHRVSLLADGHDVDDTTPMLLEWFEVVWPLADDLPH
jgi:uncharacterized protein YhfF